MTCEDVQPFIIAFADGELDERENPEVVSHVATCEACRRLVEGQRKLRAAMVAQMKAVPVPGGLQARLREALASSDAQEPASPTLRLADQQRTTPSEASPPVRRRWFRPSRVFALAACLVAAVTAVWHFSGSQSVALTPELLITQRHQGCCAKHDAHQHPGLPTHLEGLAASITAQQQQFHLNAIAPDLSAHNFAFESANFCGVQIPTCTRGGHILYARNDGKQTIRLSVFSVPRWCGLDVCGGAATNSDPADPVVVAQADGHDLCFACWHKGDTNYICCGEVSPDEMRMLAGNVKIALMEPQLEQWFASAATDLKP